ncbi:MAG: hypothetical protein IT336_03965 [Thermomicrobiales bacterium]|nr:hypothetical protein [Thermomicrobiales bacterium]
MSTAPRSAAQTIDANGVARDAGQEGTVQVPRSEGLKILDRQAQKYLGMSGDEFARKYRAGQIPDPDRSEVVRVAMLLPYAKR